MRTIRKIEKNMKRLLFLASLVAATLLAGCSGKGCPGPERNLVVSGGGAAGLRLGHWLERARDKGKTPEEKKLYEWNARVQITTWGNRTCADKGGLRDYGHKEWQGMLKDFYYMRWHTYLDALSKQMTASMRADTTALGGGQNADKTSSELFAMALPKGPVIDWYALEEPWTRKENIYSSACYY